MNEPGQAAVRDLGTVLYADAMLRRIAATTSLAKYLRLLRGYLLHPDPPLLWQAELIDAALETDRLSALTDRPTSCWRTLARHGIPTAY